jgi:hypothetical protein
VGDFVVSELREAFQLALTHTSSTEVQKTRWRCDHVFEGIGAVTQEDERAVGLGRVWRTAVWGRRGWAALGALNRSHDLFTATAPW